MAGLNLCLDNLIALLQLNLFFFLFHPSALCSVRFQKHPLG